MHGNWNRGGYDVCTNVGAIDGDAIQGTIPVFINIKDMQEFVEKAGVFISLRSGLCDIVGNVDCKKIILYHFGFISKEGIKELSGLYSLKKMGFGGELSEYVIDKENEADILAKILQELV